MLDIENFIKINKWRLLYCRVRQSKQVFKKVWDICIKKGISMSGAAARTGDLYKSKKKNIIKVEIGSFYKLKTQRAFNKQLVVNNAEYMWNYENVAVTIGNS